LRLKLPTAMSQDFIDPISEFEQSVCIERLEFPYFRFYSTLRIADPQDASDGKIRVFKGRKPNGRLIRQIESLI